MFTLDELHAAADVVYRSMPPTAQYPWPLLAERLGCEVWIKHENHTPIGAFKVRGGLVYMDRLKRDDPACAGVISATRGNHGQSLAYAGAEAGIPVTIVVPRGNSREKNAAMRAFGAELVEAGHDFDAAREAALRFAEERGLRMVLPFERELVRGVATYARELLGAVDGLDVVYVSIGLGSGICGLLRVRDLLGLKTRIVGVVSAAAPAYALSYKAGRVVTTPSADTLADGMACRVPMEEPLSLIREGADHIVQVTDDEIKEAIVLYYQATHNVAEGAGAAPLAAALKERSHLRGRKVALILSGGNIDLPVFLDVAVRHGMA